MGKSEWQMKKFPLEWFLFTFYPLNFFKSTFIKNYDRSETQTFRVDYLGYELVIGTKTVNLRPYHGKMVDPLFEDVGIWKSSSSMMKITIVFS